MSSNLPKSIDQDFERVQAAFQAIAQYKGSRRRYALAVYAPFFGIPRAEFRKIFELWLMEGMGHE